MPFFAKPDAGSWTENWPELGTAPVNYSDSIDPEHWMLEQQAIFKKTWLKVGRVEQLPKKGSYFTREMPSVGPGHVGDHRQGRKERRSFEPSTTCAGTAATSWCGATTPARRCPASAASSPASTTRGATRSTAT